MNSGVILQSFEQQIPADGSLWRAIGERAGSFAKMGISAVWMPPMCKCAAGGGSLGYDTYDLYDFGGEGAPKVASLIVTLKGTRYCIVYGDDISKNRKWNAAGQVQN